MQIALSCPVDFHAKFASFYQLLAAINKSLTKQPSV
jgi:hypothetical protein